MLYILVLKLIVVNIIQKTNIFSYIKRKLFLIYLLELQKFLILKHMIKISLQKTKIKIK